LILFALLNYSGFLLFTAFYWVLLIQTKMTRVISVFLQSLFFFLFFTSSLCPLSICHGASTSRFARVQWVFYRFYFFLSMKTDSNLFNI